MKPSKNFALAFVLLTFVAIIGSAYLIFFNKKPENSSSTQNSPSTIKLINGSREVTLKLEIADTESERQNGYMNRKEISNEESMLFIFDDSAERSFWMKDTYVALDMIFFDENKNFISIQKNAEPCLNKGYSCPSYNSNGNTKYVLETKAGALSSDLFDRNLRFEY